MLTEKKVDNFLKNNCTAEERAEVLDYLEKHPEALNNYLNEDEWKAFVATDNLPKKDAEKIFKKIQFSIYKKQLLVTRFGYTLAAASVIVMAIIGLRLLSTTTKQNVSLAANKPTTVTEKQLVVRANTTDHNLQLIMEDNSIVELSPKSSISYNAPFVNDNKRVIYLKGEAYFKVTKNKTSPFTVFSGAIATTALGTSFTIKCFDADNYIKVHLHTGKVVVTSANEKRKKLDKTLYLQPDNILLYNKAKLTASINQLDASYNLVKINDAKTTNNYRVPNWFMFNNQSLSQVLNQLEEMFGTTIIYNAKDVSSMYIIGKFDKTDTLENILKTIVKLNGLTIKKQNGSYIISK
ncbi:MAG: FecR family protein [Deinococcales bacterium]|nr:FecR family protein [Chitinophagaceae bacterium]